MAILASYLKAERFKNSNDLNYNFSLIFLGLTFKMMANTAVFSCNEHTGVLLIFAICWVCNL